MPLQTTTLHNEVERAREESRRELEALWKEIERQRKENELPARKREQKKWDELVFSFLRKNPTKPHARRIENILDLIVSAQTQRDEFKRLFIACNQKGRSEFFEKWQKAKEQLQAYTASLKILDHAFKRYRWRSVIFGTFDGIHQKLGWGIETKDSDVIWEYGAVQRLLDAIKEPGAISRLRRCLECRTWFYAGTAHQHFCKDSCRRRNASRNPEFREKRRIYMKDRYRPLQKELEQRSTRHAKNSRERKG